MQPFGNTDESAPKRGYTIQRCSQTQGKADMYPSRLMRIQADSILSPLLIPARPRRITKKGHRQGASVADAYPADDLSHMSGVIIGLSGA